MNHNKMRFVLVALLIPGAVCFGVSRRRAAQPVSGAETNVALPSKAGLSQDVLEAKAKKAQEVFGIGRGPEYKEKGLTSIDNRIRTVVRQHTRSIEAALENYEKALIIGIPGEIKAAKELLQTRVNLARESGVEIGALLDKRSDLEAELSR